MCSCYFHTWKVHVDLCRWNVQSKNAQQEEGAPVCLYKGYRKSVSHLRTISLNFDTVKKHFPEYFLGDDEVDEEHDQIVQDDEEDNVQFQHYANNDDVNIALETEGNFIEQLDCGSSNPKQHISPWNNLMSTSLRTHG